MPCPRAESIEGKCGVCEYPAKVGASRKLRASGGRNDSGTSEKSSNTGRARQSSNHLAQPVGRRAIRHTRRIVGTLILDARAEFISPIPGRSRWCGVASRICIICLDRQRRLNITTLTGVQVFDAGGQYLGTIKVPRQPANVAFGGPDKRTLYSTAREGLYGIKALSQRPDRVGK
jgi:hypothetical protein